jgi:hypothetical protein
VLNIYTLAGKKFLKWTNEDCSEEYYTALENIRTFVESKNGLLQFVQVAQAYYCNTSYKFSDLEDSVIEYSGDHIYLTVGLPEII